MPRLAMRPLTAIMFLLSGCDVSDQPFCQAQVECVDCADADSSAAETGCISFEEAAELAQHEDSGIVTLTTRVEAAGYGIINAYAQNASAICASGTCYLRADGAVKLTTYATTQTHFVRWHGCSDSTDSELDLSSLAADTECMAEYVAGEGAN